MKWWWREKSEVGAVASRREGLEMEFPQSRAGQWLIYDHPAARLVMRGILLDRKGLIYDHPAARLVMRGVQSARRLFLELQIGCGEMVVARLERGLKLEMEFPVLGTVPICNLRDPKGIVAEEQVLGSSFLALFEFPLVRISCRL
ncbi:hypothetical protein Pyn_21060 [Prunus yedoensis var. nudiflora]|uniref:Uncharacterized protein n=1 Tax=Prunus yedoensis var. nudiflora TaxID=2094558 RepID=A0A314ZNR1_PRUYE|nr:hypothetical protein Pyn_21060 [Prunus yedoensis var. nudiflora]